MEETPGMNDPEVTLYENSVSLGSLDTTSISVSTTGFTVTLSSFTINALPTHTYKITPSTAITPDFIIFDIPASFINMIYPSTSYTTVPTVQEYSCGSYKCIYYGGIVR